LRQINHYLNNLQAAMNNTIENQTGMATAESIKSLKPCDLADEILDLDKQETATELSQQSAEFKPSPLRFLVAGFLCLSSAMSAYILQTYVTIWYLTMDTYGVSSMQVNMFSLVYAIFYIPGSMLSIALYAKYGLSPCIVTGAFFNFLSTWVRAFGALSPDPTSAYNVMLFGQILAALGQPFLLNCPPR
jgi:hypothetical protein